MQSYEFLVISANKLDLFELRVTHHHQYHEYFIKYLLLKILFIIKIKTF